MQVPQEAWELDLVFSDSAKEAAFYDNNNGLDYHVPVVGGSQKKPKLHVCHVAVEMAPVAKVGCDLTCRVLLVDSIWTDLSVMCLLCGLSPCAHEFMPAPKEIAGGHCVPNLQPTF